MRSPPKESIEALRIFYLAELRAHHHPVASTNTIYRAAMIIVLGLLFVDPAFFVVRNYQVVFVAIVLAVMWGLSRLYALLRGGRLHDAYLHTLDSQVLDKFYIEGYLYGADSERERPQSLLERYRRKAGYIPWVEPVAWAIAVFIVKWLPSIVAAADGLGGS